MSQADQCHHSMNTQFTPAQMQ